MSTLVLLGSFALFLVGLRLSAFFSGVETGFYRVSPLRLGIDAQAGDPLSNRILWFVRNPSHFVATTLVGNNVANYITTMAIGFGVACLFQQHNTALEILGTLCVAPVVFIAGELIPKSLYYRAPQQMLRRDITYLSWFHVLFFIVSLPLIGISRFFQRFGNVSGRPKGLVLGRSRLVQVLSQGHREGLLTHVQNQLVESVVHMSAPVVESTTPAQRILGVPEETGRDEVLEFARQYGVTNVMLSKQGANAQWHSYVRVADVAVSQHPPMSLMRKLPHVPATMSKLRALQVLREANEYFALVYENNELVGIVSNHGLSEQLFRSPEAVDRQFSVKEQFSQNS